MRTQVERFGSRAISRLAVLAVIAGGAASCSSDTNRFNSNPFASRKQAPAEVTGSVRAAPSGKVETTALPPPAAQPVAGGTRGLATYQPPPVQPTPPRPEITGSIPPGQPAQPAPAWSWEGGTAVTVQPGDTLTSLSQRYGVPVAAIAQANNLTPNGSVQPGQKLVIPRYSAATPTPAPPTTRLVSNTPQLPASMKPQASVHVVAPGETIFSLARRYKKSPAEIARANKVGLDHKVRIGDRVVIPGAVPATMAAPRPAQPVLQPVAKPIAQAKPQPVPAPKAETPVAKPHAPKLAETTETTPKARLATPAEATPEPAAPESTTGTPSFRWPVRGRVIAAFGPKPNGPTNDGINLAVPEGTSVKAAEDGVVAYAGSELKGYGNMVLVRHASGFVTTYAHLSEIAVKRNDQIKRGQIIGKAGQTGNVTSPQLHFEVRKGATPVDPMPYLNGT